MVIVYREGDSCDIDHVTVHMTSGLAILIIVLEEVMGVQRLHHIYMMWVDVGGS